MEKIKQDNEELEREVEVLQQAIQQIQPKDLGKIWDVSLTGSISSLPQC